MPESEPISLQFVSEEYRALIGQVVVQWGILEVSIESAIWQASGVRNDVGRTFTAQLMMQSKMDLLTSMLHQTHPKLAPHFESVAIYIRNCLIGKRNIIVHGLWFQLPDLKDTASVIKFSAKGRLTSQGGPISKEELKEHALRVAELHLWMFELCRRLPPLQQRPDGLGHKTPEIPPPQNCANLRERALQPLPSGG